MLFKDLPIFDYDDDTTVTVSHNGADYLEISIADVEKFMDIEVTTFNIDDFDDEVFIEVRVSEIDFDRMKDIVPECYFIRKELEMSIETKLNLKNHGSLFQGRTWNDIFGYLANEKDDSDTWIEPVYVHAPLFSEKPLMVDHYNLCGYGNHREYRNKIPKELNSFIEEHLSHLIEG